MALSATRRASIVLLSMFPLLSLAPGCAMFRSRGPAALTAPAAEVGLNQFMGTPLSGPQASGLDDAAIADAWRVSATITAVRTLPTDGFESVGPLARLVVGPDIGTVLAPTSRLIYAVRLRGANGEADLAIAGPAEGRSELATFDAGVAVGSTAAFQVRLPDDASRDLALSRRAIEVMVARRGSSSSGAYELALRSVDLLARPAPDDIAAEPSPNAKNKVPAAPLIDEAKEVVSIDRALVDGVDRLLLAIPMSFPGSEAQGVVVQLIVQAAPADADELRDKMQQQIAAAAAKREGTILAATPGAADLDVARSLEALGAPGTSLRGTLLFLSRTVHATLTEVVLNVADDRVVELINGNVQSRLPQLLSRDARSVAWLLDRSTIAALASIREGDAAVLLPPIQGALSIHVGEAGRQLDMLSALAKEAGSSEDLFSRVVAEHLILLEESSPALRVRAYDWLIAQGRALPGYDPLAPQKQRRAALDQMLNGTPSSATAPATTPSTAPVGAP